MGELTFIKDGFATTLHDDGTATTTPVFMCDNCNDYVPSEGGMTYRLADGMDVLWMCSKCRK